MSFTFKQIGYIESPFEDPTSAPIQPCFSEAFGTVVVYPEYQDALKDLDGFSNIILIYYFDRTQETELLVKPFLTDDKKGLFATRHTKRPNKIGLSIVKLVKIEGNKVLIRGIDCLNDTPLLDIKPFVPLFDLTHVNDNCQIGWLQEASSNRAKKNHIGR